MQTWKVSDGGHRKLCELETQHLANIIRYLTYKKYIIDSDKYNTVLDIKEELEKRQDLTVEDFRKFQMALKTIEETDQVASTYNIRIQSPFILTPSQVKT